jgi:hypothetical protein
MTAVKNVNKRNNIHVGVMARDSPLTKHKILLHHIIIKLKIYSIIRNMFIKYKNLIYLNKYLIYPDRDIWYFNLHYKKRIQFEQELSEGQHARLF